jgi:hypothetical protein
MPDFAYNDSAKKFDESTAMIFVWVCKNEDGEVRLVANLREYFDQFVDHCHTRVIIVFIGARQMSQVDLNKHILINNNRCAVAGAYRPEYEPALGDNDFHLFLHRHNAYFLIPLKTDDSMIQ